MLNRLNQELKDAMREKNEVKVNTLRYLLSEIKKVMIEERKRETGLNSDEIIEIIKRSIKMRKEAMEEYKKANRMDRVAEEEAELKLLEVYLPKQLDVATLEAAITEFIAKTNATKKDFGTVMKSILAQFPGQVDGKMAKELITKKLS